MPNERNVFGRFQDVVAGPQGQPGNLELLGALLRSLGPQAAMRQQAQLPLPGLNVPGAMAGQPAIRPQGLGQGILQQLGGGIQSPAFPFVPPVPQQAMQPMMGRQAQAAPGIAPGAPPVTPPPTGAAGQITAAGAPTGAKKGITDQQRQLLALALQVGLPLALAGFGGGRGLAMGAGLAKGFGAAATTRAETEEKQLEREAKTEQQDIENRLKIIEEARKQAEAQRKEIEARLKVTKGAKKFPGVKKTIEERLAETKGLFRPGEEIAERVTKAKERALTKPKKVTQEDWNAATEAQRRDLLEALR